MIVVVLIESGDTDECLKPSLVPNRFEAIVSLYENCVVPYESCRRVMQAKDSRSLLSTRMLDIRARGTVDRFFVLGRNCCIEGSQAA